MPNVYIQTYGCQMNKLDSELILNSLSENGFSIVDNIDSADVVLVNTCSVRKHAEERVYSNVGALKHLKKRKPNLVIGIIGCMAEKDKNSVFKRLPHVDVVSGPGTYNNLIDFLKNHNFESPSESQIFSGFNNKEINQITRPLFQKNKYSAFVKLMSGCSCRCSYCIVPSVRGPEISRHPDEILEEINLLVNKGVIEVTLLAQNVTRYGLSMQNVSLSSLLKQIANIPQLKLIKFITSHPSFFTDELIETVAMVPKISKYIHMPAQSGSNAILKKMKRGYTREKYMGIVETAKRLNPEIEFASDFIVGFPSETNEDFQLTVTLIKQADFINSFIFKYSPRPGAPSFSIHDDVPIEIKKQRNNDLLDIQKSVSLMKNKKLLGKKVTIICDGQSRLDVNNQIGRTSNNYIVAFESEIDYTGKMVQVEIFDCTPLTLLGKFICEIE